MKLDPGPKFIKLASLISDIIISKFYIAHVSTGASIKNKLSER